VDDDLPLLVGTKEVSRGEEPGTRRAKSTICRQLAPQERRTHFRGHADSEAFQAGREGPTGHGDSGMKAGIIAVHMDPQRGGRHDRGVLQPQIGPLIAALLPDSAQVDVVNDTWRDPDWSREYDLLFLSCLHADFDRARQISHYWRRRGARTVLGGVLASTYPSQCAPWFDAVVIGDPETTVPRLVDDFSHGRLADVYTASPYAADRVPVPRLTLAARQQILPLSLEVTRGCPFSCDFCGLTA
jgi:hypothetical protein